MPMSRAILLAATLLVGCGLSSTAAPPASTEASTEASVERPKRADWNDDAVGWVSLEEGLAKAKAEDRPLVVVVYTTWCPRCTEYSWTWSEPEMVTAADKAIVVRMDLDAEPELAARFAPDGDYIPRTLLVNPDGSVQTEVQGPNPSYRYFHTKAASVLPLLAASAK